MKDEILNNLENPRELEKLYRVNKPAFRKAFNQLYPEVQDHTSAKIWNERLNFESDELAWGSRKELIFIFIASIMAWLIARIPEIISLDEDFFYPRNLAFVVFPFLTAWFAWKHFRYTKQIFIVITWILLSALYINSLPNNDQSNTLILASLHLPLVLWTVLGYTFIGFDLGSQSKRIDFLKFNGDLLVMTAIMVLAGGLLTGITIGLFSLIKEGIEESIAQNLGIWLLVAAPLASTYLVQNNPQIINKVSPVIARIFTPLALVMLVVYLVAVVITGKDPYNDREFLLIFNLLLIGVIALIFFSVTETSRSNAGRTGILILLGLSLVTVIINTIALSAILFRITEWGITPNRLAVLGSNLLILTNLIMVTYRLYKTTKGNDDINDVLKSIAWFLPVYGLWAVFVVYLMPVLFLFR